MHGITLEDRANLKLHNFYERIVNALGLRRGQLKISVEALDGGSLALVFRLGKAPGEIFAYYHYNRWRENHIQLSRMHRGLEYKENYLGGTFNPDGSVEMRILIEK